MAAKEKSESKVKAKEEASEEDSTTERKKSEKDEKDAAMAFTNKV